MSSSVGFTQPASPYFVADLKQFTNNTTNMVRDVLGAQNRPTGRVEGPVVFRTYRSYDPFWPSVYQPVYVTSYNPRPREDNSNVLTGIFAAVVVGVTTFFVGQAIGSLEDAERELDNAISEKQKFDGYSKHSATQQERLTATDVVRAAGLKERICRRIKESAITDLILRVGLLAGASLVLIGAIYTAPAWISSGLVVSCAATALMLFNWGLNSTDRNNIRDAEELRDINGRLPRV